MRDWKDTCRFRRNEGLGAIWTLELLSLQRRLQVEGHIPEEFREEIEECMNTEVAALAQSGIDWLLNWGSAQVFIMADKKKWMMLIDCKHQNIRKWFQRPATAA